MRSVARHAVLGWGCSCTVLLAISPASPSFPCFLSPPLAIHLSLSSSLSPCLPSYLPSYLPTTPTHLRISFLPAPPAHTSTTTSYPADVWSLGIMLIEFVTGEYPLANTSIMLDMMKAIEEKDPLLAIRAAPGMYSEELVSFCESCVVRDPVMRASTEALLRHPWMELHGASSVAGCIVRVRDYFEEEERYSEKCAEKDGGK